MKEAQVTATNLTTNETIPQATQHAETAKAEASIVETAKTVKKVDNAIGERGDGSGASRHYADDESEKRTPGTLPCRKTAIVSLQFDARRS